MAIKSQKNKRFEKFLKSLSKKQQNALLKRYKKEDLTLRDIYEIKVKRYIGTSPGTYYLMSQKKGKKRCKQTPKLGGSAKNNKIKRNFR